MNVCIVGYGRMGKMVESALQRSGHRICARIDPYSDKADEKVLKPEILVGADAAIEFSLPKAVVKNVSVYAEAGVSAVVGTTGWSGEEDRVREIIKNSEIAYVAGSNFSIGAHIFFALTELAASIINSFDDYDIMLSEVHHKNKKDSPSGTALSIADIIINACKRKNSIQSEVLHRPPADDELHVASLRGGAVPGIHSILIDSQADSIELRHAARNRSGFASGAVLAAEWMQGKKGYFLAEEVFKKVLNEGRERDV